MTKATTTPTDLLTNPDWKVKTAKNVPSGIKIEAENNRTQYFYNGIANADELTGLIVEARGVL